MDWEYNPIVSVDVSAPSASSLGRTRWILGRSPRDALLHLHGSQGLGLPPRSFASSERIGGDGDVLRATRWGGRDVFIPILLDPGAQYTDGDERYLTYQATHERQALYRALSSGPVTLTVDDPLTTTSRSIRAHYKDGLSGDFGDGFHGSWQKLGLTFYCPDPWWVGDERNASHCVVPGSKPFISKTSPFFPVMLSGSTVAGEMTVRVEGDGPVFPVWEVTGPGSGLLIESGGRRISMSGTLKAGETVRFDTGAGRIDPVARWSEVSLDSELFPLEPGNHQIKVTMVGATVDTMVRAVWRERYLYAI